MIKFNLRKRDLYIGIAIYAVLYSIIIAFYLLFNFNPSVKATLDFRLAEEVKNYNAFISSYRDFSNSLFENIINKEDILKIVYEYDHAPDDQKDYYRKKLHDSLEYVYDIIKYKNYSIFHFHDPQGRSLFRFHKPGKYGDDLTDFRKSIATIIKDHKYIEGFEEGRIRNSYRFIYPLFYHGEYLGSVEMSVSIIKLLKEKDESFTGTTLFFLNDETYNKIVNEQTKKFYSNAGIKGYKIYNTFQRKNENVVSNQIIESLNKKIQDKIGKLKLSDKPTITWISFNEKNWLITFFPLTNISGEHVAIFVSYEIYYPIDYLLRGKKVSLTIGAILSFFITLFFLFVNKERREALYRQKVIMQAKEKAEEMARLKSSFLANMSHEIRTPMNGVIGMTEILKQTKLTEDQKEFVSIIESSAGSLLNVINDILDFSKIESNKIEIESISFHIRKVIEDVGDTLLLLVNKKQINLLIYIDPKIPDVVIGDPVRLRQVILNLANNAVKFTSEGEVVISAELVNEVDTDGKKMATILFKVKDTGIGISKEAQEKLFEAFSQADATINRKYGGTGLGLTISLRLVELMGGELKLESEVGKGSEFYFQLEFEVGEDTTEEYFTDAEDLSRLRVLILDDTDSNRIIFKKYFSYWGIHCDEASDVNEAVAKVKKAIENHTNYNLILADFQMPDQTGFDFGDILIKENLKRNTRLILFSSISDMIDAKTIYKHGFDAYLYKPVKYHPFRKIVFETINKQVEYKLKDSGVIEEAKQEEEVKENLEIKILLAEDNLINQKVATVTLSKLGYNNVDVANNGTEAVQMHLKNHYDLILMDIQMPVMNGLDATEKIRESERANPDAKRVKIVALTANALASDVKMYLQRGMDDVLTKPFKPNDLKRVLQ